MLKIIIPLAGSSDIFLNAGYIYPKPVIEVLGKPMIEVVLQNPSKIEKEHQFIFIVNESDCTTYHLDNTLKLLEPGALVVQLKKPTQGALCSVLMAIDACEDDDELLILNGDQLIDMDFNHPLKHFAKSHAGAGVVTFKSVHPRWSYVKVEDDVVIESAEKNPISYNAIAGFYYFSKASVFFNNAFRTIRNRVKHNGMYFISSVINEYVLSNQLVLNHHIEAQRYHSFYSPQMVAEYELVNKAN